MKKKRRFSQQRIHSLLFAYGWLAYPIIIFLIFYVGVNINSFLMSFQDWTMLDGYRFFKTDVFRNYRDFLQKIIDSPLLGIAFKNSLIFYIVPQVVLLPTQIIFSYVIFAKVRGYNVIRALTLLPNIISGFIVVLLFKKFVESALPSIMLQITGNDFPNLIKTQPLFMLLFTQIFLSLSSNIIVLPNVMGRIPDSLFESAKIDGMKNMWQELWYIIIPLVWDVLSVGLITGFAGILGNTGLLVPFYMYTAPQNVYTIGYYFYVGAVAASSDAGYPALAAGGLMMTAIMIPLTFLFKYFIEHVMPSTEM